MPMRWTPEKDQHLLLKILEVSNVALDFKAISDAWSDPGERPTPRAINEHLVKLRHRNRDRGAITNFAIGSGQKATGGVGVATPQKRRPRKLSAAHTGTTPTSGGKRKSGDDSNDEDHIVVVKKEYGTSFGSDSGDSGIAIGSGIYENWDRTNFGNFFRATNGMAGDEQSETPTKKRKTRNAINGGSLSSFEDLV